MPIFGLDGRWRFSGVVLIMGSLQLAGCAHTISDGENSAALCPNVQSIECTFNSDAGYRFNPDRNSGRDTLVIVTLSGGGVRAAALAYGTLLALREIPATQRANLLDRIDVISSVSGGSVAAGWYAAKGAQGLGPGNNLEKFLYSDNNAALEFRGLNPVAVFRYAATNYQRSDVIAGYLTRQLFSVGEHPLTFADVLNKYQTDLTQPYVILNSTDFGHETRFPFTQGHFDLLCSDLAKFPLGYAVAASANFPLVFSPIAIENHSQNCPLGENWSSQGPPNWINRYARFDTEESRRPPVPARGCPTDKNGLSPVQLDPTGQNGLAVKSLQLLELRAAREARAYLEACADDRYVHLLDGGLVDNLGVASTLEIEDRAGLEPGLYQRFTEPFPNGSISERWPRRYQNVKNILYVVVNARSRLDFDQDDRVYPLGFFPSLLRVVDTPVDATILDTQNYLAAELEIIAQRAVRPAMTCPADANTPMASNVRPLPHICFSIVSVDFDAIPDARCREAFWRLPASWTLKDSAVSALI